MAYPWKHYCRPRKEWRNSLLDACDKCHEKRPLFPQIPGVDYPEGV